MSPKELTAFRVAPELMEAMRDLKEREGLPISVQIDFAVREWLVKRGALRKADRKRVPARRRP